MKISQLDVLDTLSGDERLVVAKGGDNYGVTVKSSSQSFDHSGDGDKCLLDNGQYGPTLPFNNGKEGQILKIVRGKPTWVDPS